MQDGSSKRLRCHLSRSTKHLTSSSQKRGTYIDPMGSDSDSNRNESSLRPISNRATVTTTPSNDIPKTTSSVSLRGDENSSNDVIVKSESPSSMPRTYTRAVTVKPKSKSIDPLIRKLTKLQREIAEKERMLNELRDKKGCEPRQRCPICLQKVKTVRACPNECGHLFCAPCFFPWILQGVKQTPDGPRISCPVCNQDSATIHIGHQCPLQAERYISFESIFIGPEKFDISSLNEMSQTENITLLLPRDVDVPKAHPDPSSEWVCGSCNTEVDDMVTLSCAACDSVWHSKCAGISDMNTAEEVAPTTPWFCKVCWSTKDDGETLIQSILAPLPEYQRDIHFLEILKARRAFHALVRKQKALLVTRKALLNDLRKAKRQAHPRLVPSTTILTTTRAGRQVRQFRPSYVARL